MAELIRSLDAAAIRRALSRVQEEISAAGREADGVQVLVAVKYVPVQLMGILAEAGVSLVGENRAQDLLAKAEAHPDTFTWDFIGRLQSRKVKSLVGRVRLIHSLATDSALEQLRRHATPGTRALVEVNVAGEQGKGGLEPAALAPFLERCPVPVLGLMTMPPLARDPEASRPYFAALRELAHAHGLHELSMGTSQDYRVALQEGATIIRLGSTLLHADGDDSPVSAV